MNAFKEWSADKRILIKVYFTRQTPDVAREPEIEVVFTLHFPEDFRLVGGNPSVLVLLSVTRSDTREPVVLSDEESQAVMRAASERAAIIANED